MANASIRAGGPSGAPRVYIVLATYNGGRHLRQQLESIRAQRMRDWTLLVRDDGSADDTRAVLDEASATDSRLEIVRDGDGNLGVRANFSRLATIALQRGATHVAFADQDDVWPEDRVGTSVEVLRATEDRVGVAMPVLVHSDLELIGGDGRRLHPSFMRFQHIHHEPGHPLRTLLVQNFVTGCAMTVNRSLLEIALPVPEAALMHDWWFALCAAAAGVLVFLPEPLVAYRRHGENAVAVRGFWRTVNPVLTSWTDLWASGVRNHRRLVQQAAALEARLSDRHAGTSAAVTLTRTFVDLHAPTRAGAGRLIAAVRLGLRSQSLPRTAALYLRLLSGIGARP